MTLEKLSIYEKLQFMLKKQFFMSLKNWWNIAYTVCHAAIQITS